MVHVGKKRCSVEKLVRFVQVRKCSNGGLEKWFREEMCDSSEGENVEHLLVTCGGFKRDQWVLSDEVSGIAGTGEWLEEYGRVCMEGRCWEKAWRKLVTQ